MLNSFSQTSQIVQDRLLSIQKPIQGRFWSLLGESTPFRADLSTD